MLYSGSVYAAVNLKINRPLWLTGFAYVKMHRQAQRPEAKTFQNSNICSAVVGIGWILP
jgi:hypothetical protein